MSTTAALVAQLKAEAKAAGMTYAQLAARIGVAESTLKRNFASGEMTLSRVDAICQALRLDFAQLCADVAATGPTARELSEAQERAVVRDARLLLLATCCLSQWSVAQIVATYQVDEAQVVRDLARLDRLGIIELQPGNRYRLKVAKTFRWRPHGPVMQYFRERVVQDYFGGAFDGPDELMLLVHGQVAGGFAAALVERLRRVAEDFARQHVQDQRLPAAERRPLTLVLAARSWLFEPLRAMQRPQVREAAARSAVERAGRR